MKNRAATGLRESIAQVVRWGERCLAWRGDFVSDDFYYAEENHLPELDIFQFRVWNFLLLNLFF